MDNKERMASLFKDCEGGDAIKLRAQWLAALHERGADYVEQAPVIAAVSLRYKREDLMTIWRKLCANGAKLGAVMDRLKINRGLRALAPSVLTVGAAEILGAKLLPANASALAQQIAARTPEQQLVWFKYWDALHTRGQPIATAIWFAEHMPLGEELPEPSHMVDFLRTPRGQQFKTDWRWRDMMTGVRKWEEEYKHAKALEEAKYNMPLTPHKDAPKTWEHKGYTFTMLNTVNELRLEGADMAHCVGGYGPTVESGQSLIYTVKKGATRAGTLQISATPMKVGRLLKAQKPGDKEWEEVTAFSWRITQYKAKHNSEPSSEAKQMASEFVNACFPEPKSEPMPKSAFPEKKAREQATEAEARKMEEALREQYAQQYERAMREPERPRRRRWLAVDWGR